jgi:hypothetical protein
MQGVRGDKKRVKKFGYIAWNDWSTHKTYMWVGGE